MEEVQRKQYTREFKREAVELIVKQHYSITQAAQSLGINANMLARWRKQYLAQEPQAFPGSGHPSPEMEELRRLREENRRLKLEKEILKKAAVFFAKESG